MTKDATATKGPKATVGKDAGPPAILVADDDEGVRRLIAAILATLGYAAECCWNGKEALLAAARGTHSLLILDYEMPFFSGTEVLRNLHGRGRRVPALLLSAGNDVFFPGEFPDVVFLAKPFGLADFRAVVLGALKEGPASRSSAAPRGGGRP